MNISDLVTEARFDYLDDKAAPYLWTDDQLTRYANEACLEACQRAPLLTKVYSLAITAVDPTYTLDTSVRQVYLAKLDLSNYPLIQTTDAELSIMRGSSWRTQNGTPTHYVRIGHKITLFPNPIVNDTLVVSTSNIPDDSFYLDDDIDPAYHKSLVFYIVYKAYLLNDADAYNPVKAAQYLAMFDDKFGDKHTAKYNSVAFDNPMYGTITSGRMA